MNVTEKDYELLENLGAKLHIATPTAKWHIKVEKDGDVLYEETERAHSWTRNAYNLLVSTMCACNCNGTSFGDGQINFKTTAGTVSGAPMAITLNQANVETGSAEGFVGKAGVDTRGIVIGTSDSAYNFDDNKLSARITDGAGTGQMAHGLGTVTKAFDTNTKKFNVTHERVFNNNSSAAITVKEVGIICYIWNSYSQLVLVCRDVLGSAVDVPAASKLTVTYVMSTQFPGA